MDRHSGAFAQHQVSVSYKKDVSRDLVIVRVCTTLPYDVDTVTDMLIDLVTTAHSPHIAWLISLGLFVLCFLGTVVLLLRFTINTLFHSPPPPPPPTRVSPHRKCENTGTRSSSKGGFCKRSTQPTSRRTRLPVKWWHYMLLSTFGAFNPCNTYLSQRMLGFMASVRWLLGDLCFSVCLYLPVQIDKVSDVVQMVFKSYSSPYKYRDFVVFRSRTNLEGGLSLAPPPSILHLTISISHALFASQLPPLPPPLTSVVLTLISIRLDEHTHSTS